MKNKYVYYCDDCKCFVQENHRCQQWSTVYTIPQEAIDKLLETAHNSEYMAALEAIITEGVENNYAVQEIVLAVQRLNQRS